MSQPIATLKPLIQFIASQVINQDWYLNYLKQTTTYLPLKMNNFISKMGADDYPSYFVDQENINTLFFKGLELFPASIELRDTINQIPEEKTHLLVDDILVQMSKFDLDGLLDELLDQGNDEGSIGEEDDIPDEEQEQIRNLIRCGMLIFTDFTSLLIFGERIFSLVQKALSGDTNSFGKVIQLVPSVVKYIPEFRDMISEAIASDRSDLLGVINYRKGNFIGNSKLDYHHIYIIFYLLDVCRLLDITTNKQIIDLYHHSGLEMYEEIIEDKIVAAKRSRYLDAHR